MRNKNYFTFPKLTFSPGFTGQDFLTLCLRPGFIPKNLVFYTLDKLFFFDTLGLSQLFFQNFIFWRKSISHSGFAKMGPLFGGKFLNQGGFEFLRFFGDASPNFCSRERRPMFGGYITYLAPPVFCTPNLEGYFTPRGVLQHTRIG